MAAGRKMRDEGVMDAASSERVGRMAVESPSDRKDAIVLWGESNWHDRWWWTDEGGIYEGRFGFLPSKFDAVAMEKSRWQAATGSSPAYTPVPLIGRHIITFETQDEASGAREKYLEFSMEPLWQI